MKALPRLTLVLIPAVLLALSAVHCNGGDPDDDPSETPVESATPATSPSPSESPAPLTWNTGIAGIFSSRCYACHAWAAGYSTVVPWIENGKLEPQVTASHNISGDDKAAVLAWLSAGYPEDPNSTTPTPGVSPTPSDSPTPVSPTPTPPTALSWNNGIDAIFLDDCAACHTWTKNYDGVVSRIQDGTLRPQVAKGHHISGVDQQAVLAWIDSGYPEN